MVHIFFISKHRYALIVSQYVGYNIINNNRDNDDVLQVLELSRTEHRCSNIILVHLMKHLTSNILFS